MALRTNAAVALAVALRAGAGGCHRDAGTDAAPSTDARAASDADAAPPPPPACASPGLSCNGDPALCDRTFDAVVFPTTHNAMSNDEEGWQIPNQHFGITRQLDDGVRGLMLDTHYFLGGAYLCHGFCDLGNEPLALGLGKIRAFLDTCPREVVSIIFESYVSAADTATAFAESGLDFYAFAYPAGTPWPTLGEMIDAGNRLVVMTDFEPGTPAWYLDQWAVAWQNPYAYDSAADFSCAADRGDPANPLFIMNHFLTNPLASPANAEMINYDPLFIDRAQACWTETGRLPNFPTVDFYDIGDLFDVSRTLNGL